MNKLSISYNNWLGRETWVEIQFAGGWDELKGSELKYIAHEYQRVVLMRMLADKAAREGRYSEMVLNDQFVEERLTNVLFRLCGMHRPYLWKGLKRRAFLSLLPDEVADCVNAIRWVYDEPKRYKAPFRRMMIGGHWHYPAADYLNNITGEEFHFSSIAYDKSVNLDELATDELCGMLYRREGKGAQHDPKSKEYCGDIREAYNSNTRERYRATGRKMSRDEQRTIVLWYFSCRLFIARKHPAVFSGKNEKKAVDGAGWLPVFRALNAGNPLNTEGVAKQHLALLLFELEERAREVRELERDRQLRKV